MKSNKKIIIGLLILATVLFFTKPAYENFSFWFENYYKASGYSYSVPLASTPKLKTDSGEISGLPVRHYYTDIKNFLLFNVYTVVIERRIYESTSSKPKEKEETTESTTEERIRSAKDPLDLARESYNYKLKEPTEWPSYTDVISKKYVIVGALNFFFVISFKNYEQKN